MKALFASSVSPARLRRIPGVVCLTASLCLFHTAQAPARQSAQQPQSTPVAEAPAAAQDQGWPRQFESSGHTIRVHQPQVEDWPDFDRIRFRAAITVSAKGKGEPKLGVLVISAATDVAFEERLVVLSQRKIEQLVFPDVEPGEVELLKAAVMEAMPAERPQTVSLDRIIAGLDAGHPSVRKVEVNLAPPKILASEAPAVMVMFMGKPRFTPIAGNSLLVAANTNWDVFLDPASSTYYLLNEESWYSTASIEKGPWAPAARLPADLSRLPGDDNWADVRRAVPGKSAAKPPRIFVSYEPAELIVTEGAPEMEPIPGTSLLMVVNTENDLFYKADQKLYFLLAAGRWFSAEALAGPWAAASASLPEDFKKIPEQSDASDVLSSVPGTPEAQEAVILASIPNKATVNKAEVTVNVTYDGEPSFKPIESTKVQCASNTPFSVFLVDGKYYCCHNAVWFDAPSPNGAWSVCERVPAEIYSIPPTHYAHNVTYVHVYESTPTTVTTGYTGGYTGAQVAATGAVMFGLGLLIGAAIDDDDHWHYHYSSCYFSYGCGARWHGYGGGYVSAGRRYGPYGGCGGYAAYNPSNGFYSRGAYAYGPRGAAAGRSAYNPSTGAGGYRVGASTPYGSWSRGAVTNGDDWVRYGRSSGARGSVGGVQGSDGGAAVRVDGRWGNGATVARNEDGDIYAGKDGNIYKRTDDGWQQQRNARSTTTRTGQQPASRQAAPTRQPPAQAGDLQREARARSRGNATTSRNQQYKRSGGGSRQAPSRGGRRG